MVAKEEVIRMRLTKRARRRIEFGALFAVATLVLVLGLVMLLQGVLAPFMNGEALVCVMSVVCLATSRMIRAPRSVRLARAGRKAERARTRMALLVHQARVTA